MGEIKTKIKSRDESNSKARDFTRIVKRVMGAIIVSIAAIIALIYIATETESITVIQIICICFLVFNILTTLYFWVRISIKDRLTDVLNIDGFTLYIVGLKMTRQFGKYNSMYMNVRNMKYINQNVGSDGGDVVLKKYAKEIDKYLRGKGKIGRLGGDNFIIVVRKEKTDEFIKFLHGIKINIFINGKDNEFNVNSRAGIYSLKPDDVIGVVFNYSSMAYTEGRVVGKSNFTWYTEELGEKTLKEKEINFIFQDAIANKEFKVYYQPKVDARNGKLVDSEALVRWERNGEIIPPGRFIPELEKSGLIKKLDFYVLERVCEDLLEWNKKGYELVPVSSNFSKYHLSDAHFIENIMKSLSANKISKKYIEIEFTESVGMEDYGSLQDFLNLMNNEGIKVAIDDFGVGYSSLELVKNPNFGIIKIDKRFVDNIENNNGDNPEAILLADIVRLCHDFDKQIVCEGVEKKEQRDILLNMDCNIIQGYLYDKPLPKEEFEKRLASPYCYNDK